MKIGIVCPYGINKGGGVQEHVLGQQAELRHRGHDARIITPRPQGYEDKPGRNTIFVGSSTDFRSPTQTTFQISGSLSDAIHDMLERQHFDILHFHEPWIPMLSSQILSRSGAVNVATFHAKLPDDPMSRTMAMMITPYTKPMLKYIDAFTAVSDAAAEYISSLTDEPIAVIPNAIDQKLFKPPAVFDDEREAKQILFVGRLEGRKGVKYLLRAFAVLQQARPDVSLLICGDGPNRHSLETLAADLELKHVKFTGYISQSEKVAHLRESDLFCSPALFGESFGIVLLEAMSTRLVTVGGDNPGYAGVMSGFGQISLVDPKETREFARRLDLLLYQPGLRRLWRQWAKAELPKYTYKTIVDQYLEVYRQALERKRPE